MICVFVGILAEIVFTFGLGSVVIRAINDSKNSDFLKLEYFAMVENALMTSL